ncbi:MAG TPA: phosphopyruvate hydratase [Methanomassiliicoccales archaeon]|nr:phosphopyruvate hydratase [Methanomassiliicoccales archaeon]HPR98874.1 phosphopyruvate hydratase [Methanomassiliicoccales archaeon]
MSELTITRVWGREVLDSRGNPTVEAQVETDAVIVTAIAPSGASTGTFEALELRDGDSRYGGKGVQKAVRNVRDLISPRLKGMDVSDLRSIDAAMIELDGTENMGRLGGNATTAVSYAAAKAGAILKGVELHEHLGSKSKVLPVPSMNVINGGKHAGSNLKIQEFMIVPCGMPSFSEALRAGVEVYHNLKTVLKKEMGPMSINVGDEGGFAPSFDTSRQAMDVLIKAIEAAGYQPGKEVYLAMDAAASEFYSKGVYTLDGKKMGTGEIVDFYSKVAQEYPLISLEDPVHEEGFEDMVELTRKLGKKLQIMGDDMFVTNPVRLRKGIEMGAGNAMLLKVNQIGTITKAMQAAEICFDRGYNVQVSHRSGESEDTTMADIAVALECGQIKSGAPARTERTAKYNRLLRIEENLGSKAKFMGRGAFF